MSELPPGVYDTLLTQMLASRLPDDRDLYHLEQLEAAEGPAVLASYLAKIVERALQEPGRETDLRSQITFSNRLISNLLADSSSSAGAGDLVANEGIRLLEVLRPPATPLSRLEALPRPTTPLSQNALLIPSKQAPALAAELRRELASADRIDLLCAFVRWSGVRVLLEELRRARARGVRLRVITTTYTGATEPRALEALAAEGAEIRVSYDNTSTRLHAKAWLFERESGLSTAYVGSSNLSHSALHDGLEWNVRLSEAASPDLLRGFRAAFDTYWEDPCFEPYDPDVFRGAIGHTLSSDGNEITPFELQPYPFQREMLYQLEVERKRHGHWRNLVVAATGTGKTALSAFDFKRVRDEWKDPSLLFVAHRREILEQARRTFRDVLRDGSFGELMVGDERPRDGRAVFASIQALGAFMRGQPAALSRSAYDVVIVDEFHHAAARTYTQLLDHLTPKLLLGMTATPERTDGLDVKRWFDGRIAVELRLWDALEQGLLCPFQYFGVADDVDLSALSWHRGGYRVEDLETIYTADDLRVRKILRAIDELIEDPERMRALGFCVSVRHAEFMADRFRKAKLRAEAVSSDSSQERRAGALARLRTGELNVVFAVDLFNEGVDVPDINTVLFLRPTESPVVFLQQLGRGLRRAENKSGLTVLDFIGQQHRRFRFDTRFRAITGSSSGELRRDIEEGFPFLPAGCSITLDRQSERIILDNIRRAVGARSLLTEQLREAGDISLAEFIADGAASLDEIYSGTSPGWTALRREAGFIGDSGPDEAMLSRALARMLHIEDPDRVSTYQKWLAASSPPDVHACSERQLRLLNMLHFDLWSAERGALPLRESLARLWANRHIVGELRQLLSILGEQARHLTPESTLDPEIPLRVHARYSRNELLAALGEASAEHPSSWREGVRWVERYQIDVLLVTLNKSEKRFSPTTRYKDYPISPDLFHWESQSTTRESAPTGQRYIHHRERGSRVLLFVRESSVGDNVGASPFLFMGTARYVRHEDERPMQITWRLDCPMPPDFFQAARVSA